MRFFQVQYSKASRCSDLADTHDIPGHRFELGPKHFEVSRGISLGCYANFTLILFGFFQPHAMRFHAKHFFSESKTSIS